MKANFLAYGDDSKFKNILIFAFAIIHKNNLSNAIDSINRIKRSFKFPSDKPIHCRILFNEHARKKAGLDHITVSDARKMLNEIIIEMNSYRVLNRYAIFDYNCGHPLFKENQNSEIIFKNDKDNSSIKKTVQAEPKGILSMLMQLCFAVGPDGKHGPQASNCQIYVSEDKTKIKFIGEKRTRADSLYFGSSVGTSNDPANKIEPMIDESSNRAMFQIADIYAYCTSHARCNEYRGTFFKEQLSLIKYWSNATFVP